jgi:hypothetical protein
MSKWCGKLLGTVALVILAMSPSARADNIFLGIQQDGSPATPSLVQSGNGYISFTGGLGGAFSFNMISATGNPILTEPAFSTSSMDVQNVDGLSHVLNVFLTQTDLTSPQSVNSFLSSFTSQTFSGGITSVVEQTFIDPNNGWFDGTLLASQTFNGLGSASSVDSTPPLDGAYSETVEYTITTNGFGRVNDTINIDAAPQAVPEPSTLALFSTALLGLAALAATKRSRLPSLET